MHSFNRTIARDILSRLDLESSNRALFDHWLSLWEGDSLPPRARLNPAELKSFLPNLLIFDVVLDESVTVRLAGTRYTQVLGLELTGKDWLALAPQSHRAERLRIFSTVARGAVGVAHRRVTLAEGDNYVSEEILLPFAAEPGARPVLTHINRSPERYQKIKSAAQAMGDPIDVQLIALE